MLQRVAPPAFPQLLSLKEGVYDCRPKNFMARVFGRARAGWLTVEKDSQGYIALTWTTDRDTHWSLIPALSITVAKDTGELVCFMKSALTFHIHWGYGRSRPGALEEATQFAEWCIHKLKLDEHSVSSPTLLLE